MNRPLLAFAASVAILAGCDGFKEAMTAHVDVAARTPSQELSVERLAELLGTSKIPVSEDNAKALADVWVNYQLLAHASAQGDSLKDTKLIDEALWPVLAQQKASKWHDMLVKTWNVDTTASEARFNQGQALAASHILFLIPQEGLTTASKDSIRRTAESVRKRVTAANFAQLAKQYSMDPGSKEKGGMLPVFTGGTMVKEFEEGVRSIKPGEIAPGLVETQFGYHIIRRAAFSEVKDEFGKQNAGAVMQAAESTYLAKLETGGEIKFKDKAVATIKEVIANPSAHSDDETVIATSKAGNFTAERLAQWIGAYPPQQQGMLRSQIAQAADSLVLQFTTHSFIRGELVLYQADSAKVTLSPSELADVRNNFASMVTRVWTELGIGPKMLADSAKTTPERERIASAHIEGYLEKLVHDQVQFVPIPQPLQSVLREKYDYKVNAAGIARAVEKATKIRAASDSTQASQRPPSQVPLQPGTQPAPQPQQGPPVPPSKQP